MFTAFAIRGRDVICGFNLDLPDGAWTWKVHAEPDSFYVTMTVTQDSPLYAQFESLARLFPSAECRAQGVEPEIVMTLPPKGREQGTIRVIRAKEGVLTVSRFEDELSPVVQ